MSSRTQKADATISLDEYITTVLTSIAQGVNNSNALFDEVDPVFELAGGNDHFIEFQIAVELTRKTATEASAKAGIKIPYLSVATGLAARDAAEGAHKNIVKFKVRAAARTIFAFRKS